MRNVCQKSLILLICQKCRYWVFPKNKITDKMSMLCCLQEIMNVIKLILFNRLFISCIFVKK